MKLKRILALAVSLAMVLSIVPAFGLTASAAETTTVSSTIPGAEVVWSMPTNLTWSDTEVSAGLEGWTSTGNTDNTTHINLAHDSNYSYLQVYGSSPKVTATSPGYAAGAETIIIEGKYCRSSGIGSTFYQEWVFNDIDGNEIGHAWIDRSQTGYIAENPWGFPGYSSYTDVALVATNNADGTTHNNYWYVGGELKYTAENVEGKVNGFGSISVPSGGSSTWYHNMHIADLTISAVYPATETTVEVTATYTANGESVATATGKYDTATGATDVTFPEKYYSADGSNTLYYAAEQTLSESDTIEMTALENPGLAVGSHVVSNNQTYEIKSANLIPNGDFSYGLNGWYAGDGYPASSSGITLSDGKIKLGNGGAGTAQSISRSWAIENGETYLFTYNTSAANVWHITSLVTAPHLDENATDAKVVVGTTSNSTKVGSVAASDAAGTNYFVFTNDNNYSYLQSWFRWSTSTFDDFGLYKVEAVEETPELVIAPDAVTVISGNAPVLPSTVKATGSLGNELSVAVAWETTDIDFTNNGTASTSVTVHGTTEGIDDGVDITVNVLPQTFTMSDIEAYAGQDSAAVHYFPVSVSGTMAVEFDVVFKQLVNGTITIGDAASTDNGAGTPVFGAVGDAISLQTNTSGLNIRSWGANGGASSADSNVTYSVTTGETYRILITTNTDDDNWTAVMTDKNGTRTVIAEGAGYRKVVDKLDSITALDNNKTSDTISISNIKVYAPSVADQLTTYTVNVTGSVEDSYTVAATSVDALDIPYYEGNIFKSRSVDGTTVTFTYEATTTSLGSWAIRNNVSSNTWISEMKYLGTHNSFANVGTAVVNEGGKLRNSADSTILEMNKAVPYADDTSSTVVSASRTQTLDALEQLNAGVRYFDIRLTRQSDGTFWTFHGPAFCDFKPIAATIAQFANENPGEVIILDFHYAWDALYTTPLTSGYNGDTVGDDNEDFYANLEQLLKDTGVWDYIPDNFDQRYGAMTGEGTKTAILTVSKARGASCISKFQSRDSWTSGDTAYSSSGDYDTVVSAIESAISAGQFGSGAKWGIIHAYTTPLTGLISDANTNRSKWINEDLDTWMTAGYGDVLLMNNVTADDTATYLARLSEYNRDYLDDQLGNEFHEETSITSNGVSMSGATSSVPFSTELNVTAAANEQTITVDDVDYTIKTAYAIKLLQFDENSVDLAGNVTLTFPKASTDNTTVDVLFYNNAVVAEAAVGEAISYETSTLGNYLIATKAAPTVEMTVEYRINEVPVDTVTDNFVIGAEAYNIPESSACYVKFDNKAYIVSAKAQSHVVTEADAGQTYTVDYTLVHDNAVLADAFWTNKDEDNCFYGANDSNHLFIASAGDFNGITRAYATDADGETLYNTTTTTNLGNMAMGSSRFAMVQYNVPEYIEGKAYILILPINNFDGTNSWNQDNKAMRFAAYLLDNEYDVPDTKSSDKINADDSALAATGDAIISDWVIKDESTELKFDVTEAVKAASEAGQTTMTFKLLAAYGGVRLNNFEIAGPGEDKEGLASYIDVVDANTVSVYGATKVTKMGTEATLTDGAVENLVVPEGSTIKIYTTEAYVTDGTNVYAVENGSATIAAPTAGAVYQPAALGVSLVNGAQVRIGAGVTEVEGGYKIAETDSLDSKLAGSGLRFIGIVDRINTLATVDGAEIGIEIAAQDSTAEPVKVPADQYQNESNTVFTAALVNLKESNYNRIFTAKPYVTVNGVTYYGDTVSRSIYEIAAGILVDSTTVEGNNQFTYEVNDAVNNVLNAYVNQVGVRLAVDKDFSFTERTEGTGAYVGGKEGGPTLFFTVNSAANDDGTYSVTITAEGDAKIFGYWNEYIRLNNVSLTNSKYIKASALNEEGTTLTLTIDPNA